MNFRENPEEVLVKKEELAFDKERTEEICDEYAERILGTPESQIVRALFRGSMNNGAQGSLGKLMDTSNLESLLPSIKKHLDNMGIPNEFYIGTLKAIARKLESDNNLRD